MIPRIPLRSWQYVPGPRTAFLAAWDCRLSGFSENLGHPVRRLEVASARVRLVIGFDGPYLLASASATAAPARSCQAFLIGMAGDAMTTEHAAAQSCIEVDMPPWAAFSLLDGDPAALASGLLDLGDLWGPQAGLLAEELNAQPSWPACFARVERRLAQHLLAPRRRVDAQVQQAWLAMAQRHGQVSIEALRQRTGWSARHFAKRFATGIGLAPKAAAMRERFAHAHALLSVHPGAGLADLAARCGYSDQSHLAREFRQFAACTPAAWARAELPGAPGKPASLVQA